MIVKTILLASVKRQKQSLLGMFVLMFLATLSMTTAITISHNAGQYVESEMNRVGYGAFTAWVSGYEDLKSLETEINSQPDINQVQVQPVIFAGYEINGKHSDTEGELLSYEPERYAYHFFNENLDAYLPQEEIHINPGEIYLSPVMADSFQAKSGDTIEFILGRDGTRQKFSVAGYFEDPFMGSSMIDMKSFLIAPQDYEKTREMLQGVSDFNVIGQEGAMLHIFAEETAGTAITDVNRQLNTATSLGQYVEMMYSADTIYGFMLILQNIVTGFLLGFSILLLFVIVIVSGNSIRNAIAQEAKDIGILKTIGTTGEVIWKTKMIEYLTPVVLGMLMGLIFAVPFIAVVSESTVTSTGMLTPADIPLRRSILVFAGILLLLFAYLLYRTRKVTKIRPLQTILELNNEGPKPAAWNRISRKNLSLTLAARQLLTGWRQYMGVCVVMFLLTVFLSVIGRLNTWVGSNGEGLMNAFSVAEHDLGVQPMSSNFDMQTVEERIETFTEITDTYELAMENGTVNGVDLTINVLDEPEWFHVTQGDTAENPDEILITRTLAADLGVGVGDRITAAAGGNSAEYTVAGIYECANGMGANVGMNKEGYARIADVSANIWCTHYLLKDNAMRDVIMDDLMKHYRIDADIHNNSWSGLTGIVGTLHIMILCMYGISACMIGIVIALSGSKVLSFEQRNLSIYKCIGFTSKQLRISFGLRYGIVAAFGALLGIAVSAGFADILTGELLGNFGIGSFHTEFRFSQIIGSAGVIILLVFLFAVYSSKNIKKVSAIELLQNV